MANKPHYSKVPYVILGGGAVGKGLEYDWDGTKLGIRQEGDEEYEYVDLEGPQGKQGPKGEPGEGGKDGVGVVGATSDGINITFELSDGSTINIPWPNQ